MKKNLLKNIVATLTIKRIPDYEKVEDVSRHSNKIIPVAFNKEHKEMVSHLDYNVQ